MPSTEPAAPVPASAATAVPEPARQLLAEAIEHERAGRLDEAETALARLPEADRERPSALHLRGVVAFRKGRTQEAAELMERARALAPEAALFPANLCEVYRILGRYDDALAACLRATALEPENARYHHNLSVLHYHRLELDQAIGAAERALALDPELPGGHLGVAEASLLRGDFERGLEEYEWRFRMPNAAPPLPPTGRPQWDGTPLGPGETLLLIADQGYGDVIQFARYIPWAVQRCPRMAIACSRELQPVVAQQYPAATLFDRWEKQPDFAAYCPLSGLPRLAGTRIDTIPAPLPYLRAGAEKLAAWAARLGALAPPQYPRVGLAWAGRPTHQNDRNRSIDIAALSPLFELAEVTWVSLQKGPAQAQIGRYWGRAPLINLGAEIGDFGDTMAIVDGLDLVITVDTSLAHLAGAMAKPVWIMLPYAPDWRWLLDRSDTPWYPSARLFRQSAARDWPGVIAELAAEARRFLAK